MSNYIDDPHQHIDSKVAAVVEQQPDTAAYVDDDNDDARTLNTHSSVDGECKILIDHHKPAGSTTDQTSPEKLELEPLQRHQQDYGGTEVTSTDVKEEEKGVSGGRAESEGTCGEICRDGTLFAVKAAYFLLLAGHVSFMPFIPVYLADLGLNAVSIGRIRGFEALVGVFASPMCGSLADKFNKHKSLLVTSIIGTALIYGSSLFLPFLSNKSVTLSSLPLDNHQINATVCKMSDAFPRDPHLAGITNETMEECHCINKCVSYDYSKITPNGTYACLCDIGCNETTTADRQVMTGSVTGMNISSISKNRSATEDQEKIKTFKLSQHAHLDCGSSEGIQWICTCPTRGSVNTSYFPHMNRLPCFAVSNTSDPLNAIDSPSNFDSGTNTTAIFAVMLVIVLIGQIFSNPSIPLLDAATMSLIHEYKERGQTVQYGRQRIWGAIAWALVAPLSGLAVDICSSAFPNTFNRYLPAFMLFLVIMCLCALTVSFIPIRSREPTKALFRDLQTLLQKPKILMFLFIMLVTGMMVGFINSFLFLFLAELNGDRVVMGLTLTIMCFSELPFMTFAAKLIEMLSHEGVISIAIFCYALRFFGYSLLQNPWLVLPIEILHGITYGAMWPACTSFVHKESPPNMAATMQSIAYGTRVGLGKGVGTLLGGVLYHHYGARNLFRGSAGLSMFTFIFYGSISIILKKQETLKYNQL